ncbi:MAG: TVP38/TMEM64 family protein [Spirochaetales bacterium]|nr:TVP38/TMEM64 family protein [Spirochaetales bacterium]
MKKILRILIILAVLTALFFIARALGLIEVLKDYEEFKAFIEGYGVPGYLIYVFMYILVAVFSIPGTIPTLAAGVLFGPVKGGILALVSATIGATAAFLVARYLARDLIVEKFGGNPLFRKIEAGVEKNGTDFLILTRLVPIFPYNIQNYAYGVTNINIVTYALVSLITMAPASFLYAYLAGDIVANGISTELFLKLIAAGVILFAVSRIPRIFARKKNIDIK